MPASADAYDRLGQTFQIVEETAGIAFVVDAENPGEVRSSFESSPTTSGDHSGSLAAAQLSYPLTL